MVKRRRLEAPSADELQNMEDAFRNETIEAGRPVLGPGKATAPIAQVAADAAAHFNATSGDDRVETARMKTNLRRLEQAESEGRLISRLALDDIDADVMVRDRSVLNEADMTELQLSIAANGLRLPIEVYELSEPGLPGKKYALLSGYRRLLAMRNLYEFTGKREHAEISALIRPRAEADAAFVAMIEENEVRAELSNFERGRIAVIASQQGAFLNVEDAVNRLYATGSKAKRSKIRSFALIFEDLGDMLEFPEALTEKRGLRLARALREGDEPRLRNALADSVARDPEEEWQVLDALLTEMEKDAKPDDRPHRGGRPRSAVRVPSFDSAEVLHTSAGVTIRKVSDEKGYLLRLEGKRLDDALVDSVVQEIRILLENS